MKDDDNSQAAPTPSAAPPVPSTSRRHSSPPSAAPLPLPPPTPQAQLDEAFKALTVDGGKDANESLETTDVHPGGEEDEQLEEGEGDDTRAEAEQDEAGEADAGALGLRLGVKRYGRCKFFDATKGFGFILDDNHGELGGDEVFVHYSAIHAVQGGPRAFRALSEGEEVEYTVVQGPKGWQAQNVTGPAGAPCVGLSVKTAPPHDTSIPRHPSQGSLYAGGPYQVHSSQHQVTNYGSNPPPLWSPALSDLTSHAMDSGYYSSDLGPPHCSPPATLYHPQLSPYAPHVSLPHNSYPLPAQHHHQQLPLGYSYFPSSPALPPIPLGYPGHHPQQSGYRGYPTMMPADYWGQQQQQQQQQQGGQVQGPYGVEQRQYGSMDGYGGALGMISPDGVQYELQGGSSERRGSAEGEGGFVAGQTVLVSGA